MSRYIDAEYVKAVMLNDRLMQGNAEFTLYVQQVETQVKALPGIDIVRCGECKHWCKGDEVYGICYRCPNTRQMRYDDFCSYGSRSEKPNNCEVKNYCDDCLYTDTCDSKAYFYACTSKATISKMEQVDKDINVRSKDEPQQKSCATCKHALGNWDGESNNCGRCCGADRRFYEPKDEQTERNE